MRFVDLRGGQRENIFVVEQNGGGEPKPLKAISTPKGAVARNDHVPWNGDFEPFIGTTMRIISGDRRDPASAVIDYQSLRQLTVGALNLRTVKRSNAPSRATAGHAPSTGHIGSGT